MVLSSTDVDGRAVLRNHLKRTQMAQRETLSQVLQTGRGTEGWHTDEFIPFVSLHSVERGNTNLDGKTTFATLPAWTASGVEASTFHAPTTFSTTKWKKCSVISNEIRTRSGASPARR